MSAPQQSRQLVSQMQSPQLTAKTKTILKLVAFAWAGFGAAFGPIILLSLYWRKLTNVGALAGMMVGAITVLIWGNVHVLTSNLYEIVPGFLLNLIVTIIVSRLTYKENPEITHEFDETLRLLEEERAKR